MTQQIIQITEDPMDEKRCEDPAPHDPHDVRDGDSVEVRTLGGKIIGMTTVNGTMTHCPGRRAHANVMIGRE